MVGMKCMDTGGILRIIATDDEPRLWPHMEVGDDILLNFCNCRLGWLLVVCVRVTKRAVHSCTCCSCQL
jgi:hypothetical protein